jgi:hypothetical protein
MIDSRVLRHNPSSSSASPPSVHSRFSILSSILVSRPSQETSSPPGCPKAIEPHLNYSRSRDAFAIVPSLLSFSPPESPLFATNLHGACLKKRFMLDYIHPYRFWCSLRKSNGRTPGLDPCIAALFRSVRSAGLTGPEYPITHRVTTQNQASSTGNHVR